MLIFALEMQNVFLTQSGKVKLGDFGSARHLAQYVDIPTDLSGVKLYFTIDKQSRVHKSLLLTWHFLFVVSQSNVIRLHLCGNSLLCTSRNMGKSAIQQQKVLVFSVVTNNGWGFFIAISVWLYVLSIFVSEKILRRRKFTKS